MSFTVVPHTVPGPISATNAGSLAWGPLGIAWGCRDLVVLLEARSGQHWQVLAGHTGDVSQVTWISSPGPLSLSSPADRQLATADSNGTIIVWDVHKGTVAIEFGTKAAKLNKPIASLVRRLQVVPCTVVHAVDGIEKPQLETRYNGSG